MGQGGVEGGWTGVDAVAGGGRARSRPVRYVFSRTNSSRRSPSKSCNMVSIGHKAWGCPYGGGVRSEVTGRDGAGDAEMAGRRLWTGERGLSGR